MKDKYIFSFSTLLFILYYLLSIPIIIIFLYILQNLLMIHIVNRNFKNKAIISYRIIILFLIVESISLTYVLTKFYTSLTWGIIFSLILALEPWGLYYYRIKYIKKN